MKWCRVVALFLGISVSSAALAQGAVDEPDPDSEPVILVASENLADPVYSHTVLIAKPIGGRIHVGVILNKQTDRTLASLFPQHEPSKLVRENVYFGGPMARSAVTALTHVAPSASDGVVEISKDLFFVLHIDAIDAIIEKTPNAARYYIGNVIWRPGELATELENGLWDVLPMSSDIPLRRNIAGLWSELHDSSSLLHARLNPTRFAGPIRVAGGPISHGADVEIQWAPARRSAGR